MQPVNLALLWHQHQPYYPDRIGGDTLMPWVRLHGIKDYWGMAWHIKEVPEFRCTINLVPSLLQQLRAYTHEGASDRHLDLSRMPADSLGAGEAQEIVDQFFMANMESMIRPYPRYMELFQKRGTSGEPAERVVRRFSDRDFRDLQVWNNLTWMHPLLFERDPDLQAFRQKAQNFTEGDKAWLLAKQLDVLREVIPLHQQLMESGQLELTTTPFFHPILPLLCDKRTARQAMPGCALPHHLESYREDAVIHLQRAIKYHTELFGRPPVGMWPSEGSVSQEVIALIADVGIQWIATDEEILSASTNGWVGRDGNGFLRHPEMLYRPWRLEEQGRHLQAVFRDHALSDLIGFQYQRADATQAVNDFLGKLDAIRHAVEPQNHGRPVFVPVILDGENCWEYYPDGGVQFLRTLYRQCVARGSVRPVKIGDYLRDHPATDRIGQLFAGSWISHNFAIWIGHEEDNTAWDLLHQTREFLKRVEAGGDAAPDVLARAWEEIYIAEGSDWYWWFGDDHSSAQDALFDQLFRKHLKNVYIILRTPYPPQLDRPISRGEQRPIHTHPKGFLPVKVDGRRTYFEWINAGQYVSGSERGTMTMVTQGLVQQMYFGFDRHRFLLRLDTAERASDDLREVETLQLTFLEPAGAQVFVHGFAAGELAGTFFRENRPYPEYHIEAAVGAVLELSVPLEALRHGPNAALEFSVELNQMGSSQDRLPREGLISLRIPSADFESLMWQA
ncbi:MAG TPA: glycoside hydrolase family 57 protein [Planctomycetaceae bacterium]|nr:glycoside hydrolase family 57 protein [Planctomycetaceae bacterium]